MNTEKKGLNWNLIKFTSSTTISSSITTLPNTQPAFNFHSSSLSLLTNNNQSSIHHIEGCALRIFFLLFLIFHKTFKHNFPSFQTSFLHHQLSHAFFMINWCLSLSKKHLKLNNKKRSIKCVEKVQHKDANYKEEDLPINRTIRNSSKVFNRCIYGEFIFLSFFYY